MKSKFLIFSIFTLVLLVGCTKPNIVEVKEPHFVGEIIEIDTNYTRFLLRSTDSTINPNKRGEIWLSVSSDSQMINQNNKSLTFDNLQMGMIVEVNLVGGIVLDSEPQKGTVKDLSISRGEE
ncbi:hypothetical protein [Providencia sp. NPDC089923]|uniref:hypothetical protein n=1 Tax=Providencia sp. NPDC089923 TaxID=3415004 RepID=UPI003C3012AD